MNKPILYNITLSQFRSFFPEGQFVGLEEDFYILNAKLTDKHSPLQHPCRFNGYMLIYCISGHMRLNVNLSEVELKENMMFVNVPGNILKVTDILNQEDCDIQYVVVAMSERFMSRLVLDVNKVFTEGLSLIDNPIMEVRPDYASQMYKSIEMITSILKSDVQYKSDIVTTMMSSVFYLVAGLWSESVSKLQESSAAPTSRGRMIFEMFMKLVKEYHTKYRNVGFYADKLCLTPKYLSKLIKNASGRSAPEWIDAYVILEAKNLLKHSNTSIKEIVFTLNFPNQSVFYKFFKARTGMTPSEYRNS